MRARVRDQPGFGELRVLQGGDIRKATEYLGIVLNELPINVRKQLIAVVPA